MLRLYQITCASHFLCSCAFISI